MDVKALAWLLSVPRASSTVLEATIPYSRASMVNLLGKVGAFPEIWGSLASWCSLRSMASDHVQVPAKSVCRETADEIALAAYNRALKLSMPGTV